MGAIGGTELIIILAIVVLLFGATAIPKIARSFGQAKREFEKGIDTNQSSTKEISKDKETKLKEDPPSKKS